jgi:hypothetical protein
VRPGAGGVVADKLLTAALRPGDRNVAMTDDRDA